MGSFLVGAVGGAVRIKTRIHYQVRKKRTSKGEFLIKCDLYGHTVMEDFQFLQVEVIINRPLFTNWTISFWLSSQDCFKISGFCSQSPLYSGARTLN